MLGELVWPDETAENADTSSPSQEHTNVAPEKQPPRQYDLPQHYAAQKSQPVSQLSPNNTRKPLSLETGSQNLNKKPAPLHQSVECSVP